MNGAKSTAQSALSILYLQIVYMMITVIIPLLLLILLLGIWLVPLTLNEQLLFYFVAEILYAWESTVVLLLAFVAAVAQISQLGQFVVETATGSLCGALEEPLQQYFPDPIDAKCFDAQASLLSGSIPLFLAVFLVEISLDCHFRHDPCRPQ